MVFLQVVYGFLTPFNVHLQLTKSMMDVSYLLVNILVYTGLQLIGVNLLPVLTCLNGHILNGVLDFIKLHLPFFYLHASVSLKVLNLLHQLHSKIVDQVFEVLLSCGLNDLTTSGHLL